MIPHYHINVFWSDEDGCWIADVPDLPSCSARGDTAQEVVSLVQQAMIDWVAGARDKGLEIPQPHYQPDAA